MDVKEHLRFFAEHGMSITYIANRMNVSPSTLTKWLNGQKGITHKHEGEVFLTLKLILEELQENLG